MKRLFSVRTTIRLSRAECQQAQQVVFEHPAVRRSQQDPIVKESRLALYRSFNFLQVRYLTRTRSDRIKVFVSISNYIDQGGGRLASGSDKVFTSTRRGI